MATTQTLATWTLYCPRCDKDNDVAAPEAGKRIQCQHCHAHLKIEPTTDADGARDFFLVFA